MPLIILLHFTDILAVILTQRELTVQLKSTFLPCSNRDIPGNQINFSEDFQQRNEVRRGRVTATIPTHTVV